MKNISTFLLMFVVLLGSCVKKKEKTDESLSADKAVVTETSDVIYTAMVVKGNVSWSSDDSLWNRLETKMPLQYGSFVETGKKSATTLIGSIGDVVQMSEQAKVQLTIEELLKQGERSSLAMRGIRLLLGKARFEIKQGGKFMVETPSARIDVKGTIFVVDVDSTGKTDVAVIEGVVNVVPLKDPSQVKELLPGKVLRNSGNVDARIDSYTTDDTLLTYGVEPVSDLNQSRETSSDSGSDNTAALLNDKEVKNRLTPTPGYHGKATQKAGTEAIERINREVQRTTEKIESEKAAFEMKKDSIANAHAEIKAAEEKKPELAREEAQFRLDNERSVVGEKMDAQRVKTESNFDEELNASRGISDKARMEAEKRMQMERSSVKQSDRRLGTSGSGDAFEELKRRRGE
jgi:hypothetical protein